MSRTLDAAATAFLRGARQTYVDANRATLVWMLDRPRLQGGFLNTKQHSITLADYTEEDGWRGPSFLYGWIQGRGLEALIVHAQFFAASDPALAARLDAAARVLYAALKALYERHGAAFFTYDGALVPVVRADGDRPVPQHLGTGYFTFADVFVLKGLIAASSRYDPAARAAYLDRLAALVAAIEADRFVIDERRLLGPETVPPPGADFGPRMILIGAAGLLKRLGLVAEAAFADRFIDHILERHWDRRASCLLSDAEGGSRSNVGHAIEFVGFALDYLRGCDDPRVGDLRQLLAASFARGFVAPGLTLQVDMRTGERFGHFPWWSLPETVRAAALCAEATGAGLDIWTAAHQAFFGTYWRGDPPIAYQTRDPSGPVDIVPGTPDLDPGYHTGLSLLAAIEAVDRMLA